VISGRFLGRVAVAFELMRWKNGLLAAASVLAASVIAQGRIALSGPVLTGAAVAFAVLGAGNALNDFYDVEIDRTNAPGRPLPSGRVRPATAVALAVGLFAAGNLAGALFLPARSLPYPAANSLLLILYGRFSKRIALLPNLAVAGMTTSAFLFAGAILGVRSANLFVLAAGAFLTNFAREIFKDIKDMRGDARMAARTLPLSLGFRAASRIARMSLVPALALLVIPPAAGWTNPVYALFGVPAFALLASIYFASPACGERRIKIAMPVVLAAFVAGSL
jgi:geranylgeranylglycerol-phosphate geranylgeranyltransferase